MTLRQLWRGLCYNILPPLVSSQATRRLKERLRADDLISLDARYIEWLALPPETLDKLLISERERAKSLEDKAGKLTAVLAVAFTIGGTFGKSFVEDIAPSGVKNVIRIGLLISMGFLLWGGLHGLIRGTATREQMGYGPDWELQLLKSPNKKRARAEALVHFELANILRSNDVAVALACVRNSGIMFSVTVMYAFVAPIAESIYTWLTSLVRGRSFTVSVGGIKTFILGTLQWLKTH
jgi:hypothetical protein